jgi:phage gp36-like protein
MYATLADLQERFGVEEILGLTDRDGDDQADAGLVYAVIADVSAEIDSYLSVRYDLPIDPVPRLLTRLACTLIREQLYLQDGGRLDDDHPAKVEAKASRVVLRDIAAAKAHLPISTHTAGVGEVEMTSEDVAWRRKDSQGFI